MKPARAPASSPVSRSAGPLGPCPEADREAVRLLAEFCREERPETFRALFESTRPRLLPMVRLLVQRHRSPDDPGELLTDTYAQVYRARHTFAEATGTGFHGWFLTIAQNLLRQRQREAVRRDRRERRVARSITDESSDPFVRMVRDEDREAAHRTCRDLARGVAQALKTLSPRCREVVVMHCLGRLTYKEIAYRLGITPGAVAMRMMRSREKILEWLLHKEDSTCT